MKHIKEIMENLGFRKDASEASKEAFIKHLIKAAGGPEIETPSEKKTNKKTKEPEQLRLFDKEA